MMVDKTLPEVVGANLRALRERRGWLQDDVARQVGKCGVLWSPSVVASIEAGTRSIHLDELVLAAAALSVPLRDLLAGDGWMRIAGNVRVSLNTFRSAMCSPRGAQALNREAQDDIVSRRHPDSLESRALASGVVGEVEYRTARQLGVTPSVVDTHSLSLWGRSLHEERDARVAARYGTELAPRSLQAARGHVMRSLFTELKAEVIADQEEVERDVRHGARRPAGSKAARAVSMTRSKQPTMGSTKKRRGVEED